MGAGECRRRTMGDHEGQSAPRQTATQGWGARVAVGGLGRARQAFGLGAVDPHPRARYSCRASPGRRKPTSKATDGRTWVSLHNLQANPERILSRASSGKNRTVCFVAATNGVRSWKRRTTPRVGPAFGSQLCNASSAASVSRIRGRRKPRSRDSTLRRISPIRPSIRLDPEAGPGE
jgi:hypothetical protein